MNEVIKTKRLQYRRKWKSAAKSLVNMRSDTETHPDINDSSHSASLQCNDGGEVRTMNEVPNSYSTNIVVEGHDSDGDDDRDLWDLIDHTGNATFSSDSDSELESETASCTSLTKDLAACTNQFQVKHNAVDHLLKLLQNHGHVNLPATARTLLKTQKCSDRTQIWYGIHLLWIRR